jgi:hypothetical protein
MISFRKTIRKVHRWVGLCSAFFLFIMAVTGFLLNHAAGWGWQQRLLQSQYLDYIRFHSSDAAVIQWAVDGNRISYYQGHLFLGDTCLFPIEWPEGIRFNAEGFALLTADQQYLISHSGELLETTVVSDENRLDEGFDALGVYLSGTQRVEFLQHADPVPISLFTLIFEIHTGQIWGHWGWLWPDLIAGSLGVMILSGLGILMGRREKTKTCLHNVAESYLHRG